MFGPLSFFFFFFNDTATTEIYTLSLHDALPIFARIRESVSLDLARAEMKVLDAQYTRERSEEHTSELQSPDHLVCRLLLEKKKNLKPFNRRSTTMPDTVCRLRRSSSPSRFDSPD